MWLTAVLDWPLCPANTGLSLFIPNFKVCY